jgi:hypothetical protein
MSERRRGRRVRAAGLVGPVVAALLAATPGSGQAREPVFRRVAQAFAGSPGHWSRALDAVAADADGDGDPDLLLSWHHLAALELYENDGGRLRHVPSSDAGLLDEPGVPSLYGGRDLAARLRAEGRTGLFVWHDEDRRGAWHLLWLDPEQRMPGAVAHLETSLAFQEVSGAPVQRQGPRRCTLRLDAAELGLRARTRRIASELRLRVEGAEPALFVGDPPQRMPTREVSLWLPDPHGMTWVDYWGGPRPDLFVTRGALGGKLAPGLPPKRDRAFRALDDGPGLRFELVGGAVPPDRGAGRRSEWLVSDAGSLALVVGNRGRPLKLLLPTGAGGLRDATAEHRLDDVVDAFTAVDLDGDGRDDLLLLSGATLSARRNEGSHFGRPQRLVTLSPFAPSADPLQVPSLRLADFDADGALDLFALGLGERGASRLLRGGDGGFVDVTGEVGLEALSGQRVFALADWDADGFMDVVSFGDEGGVLWHNRAGVRFVLSALPAELVPERVTAAVALDVDGDRRTDLVLAGRRRHLLRNETAVARAASAVELVAGRSPVGALVRCVDASGRGAVHRLGSAHASALSQSVLPILCGGSGKPAGVEIRWPGERNFVRYPAREPGGSTRVTR